MGMRIAEWSALLHSYLIEEEEFFDYTKLVREQWPHIVIETPGRNSYRETARYYIGQMEEVFGGPGDFIMSADYYRGGNVVRVILGFTTVQDAVLMKLQLNLKEGHYISGNGYDEND